MLLLIFSVPKLDFVFKRRVFCNSGSCWQLHCVNLPICTVSQPSRIGKGRLHYIIYAHMSFSELSSEKLTLSQSTLPNQSLISPRKLPCFFSVTNSIQRTILQSQKCARICWQSSKTSMGLCNNSCIFLKTDPLHYNHGIRHMFCNSSTEDNSPPHFFLSFNTHNAPSDSWFTRYDVDFLKDRSNIRYNWAPSKQFLWPALYTPWLWGNNLHHFINSIFLLWNLWRINSQTFLADAYWGPL